MILPSTRARYGVYSLVRGSLSRVLFFYVAWGVLTGAAQADPPVALVMGSGGNVYFSDLNRVWVIRTDGSVDVAVDGVHTHELWLDSEDNLYGEDVTNVGDSYRHRIWIRRPNGSVTNERDWREGHPVDFEDFSLVRDDAGRSYVLRRRDRRIDVRQEGRVIHSVAIGLGSEPIHWMARGANGRLILAVGGAAYEVPGGDRGEFDTESSLRVLAKDLIEGSLTFAFVQPRHALMGIWTDASGNTFIAVYKGKVVKRISPQGEVSYAYRSKGLWSPSGGLIAPDGAMWIMEWSPTNSARVVRWDGVEKTVFEPG